MRKVQVIAHRGASAYAPENTATAFDLALQMGADALETDVRLSRDGVLVLCHDATVDRISNSHGDVSALTLAELKRLDVGVAFSPEHTGQRMLAADEFLERYGGRLDLALEIKAAGVCGPLYDMVLRMGILHQVVFTSFTQAWLEELHQMAPHASIGILTRVFSGEEIERVKALGFTQICPSAQCMDAPLVEKAHACGLDVRAWGVKSDADQEQALQGGADGMTTNWPDRLIARLKELGWR